VSATVFAKLLETFIPIHSGRHRRNAFASAFPHGLPTIQPPRSTKVTRDVMSLLLLEQIDASQLFIDLGLDLLLDPASRFDFTLIRELKVA
jgi:hypothetical protein